MHYKYLPISSGWMSIKHLWERKSTLACEYSSEPQSLQTAGLTVLQSQGCEICWFVDV